MLIFDLLLATREERVKAKEIASRALNDHGRAAERDILFKLGDPTRSRSRRPLRLALFEIRSRRAKSTSEAVAA